MAQYQALVEEFTDRARFYRMLSRFYYGPLNQEEVDGLDADSLKDLSGQMENPLMVQGFNDMYRYLRRKNTGTRQELNNDYTGCFGGTRTYEFLYAVPYGSVFLSPEGELMGPERGEVFRIYKAHRIKVKEGYDIPEDHLAFELEYLAILNDRAAQDLSTGDLSSAVRNIADQRIFLEEHVNTWFDRLFNLSFRLIRTRFYQGVLRVTKGFFREESETLPRLEEYVQSLDDANDAGANMR